jgi:alkylation response protein AidB-like acyl-CoA dehydrogenase
MTIVECEQIARDEGLAAGLSAALAGTEVGSAAPGRYAAVPARDVPAGAAVVEVGRLIAAVRLGVVRRLLDEAVEHLSGRVVGDEPLVRKQLIVGAIADIIAEVELLRAYANSQQDPDALADLHTKLDDLGWQVLQLFGAAGYIADHPGRALYVSALVANTWVDRTGVTE